MGLINLVKDKILGGGPGKVANDINKGNAKEKIFYLKLCGDYYRYIAELQDPNTPDPPEDPQNPSMKSLAKEMYQGAIKAAEDHLQETDPIRLGLALNWSV